MQKTVDKGSACCLTTTFRSCEHELERSRRKMTNKKFKLAAMSLATAVAVSTVGPSASAVTYYLGDGSVTVDQDEKRGVFSAVYSVIRVRIRAIKTAPTSTMRKSKLAMARSTSRTATHQRKMFRQPLITPTMAQRYPHLRIMPHNPPMLLATTQRTVPRLRPHLETPSRSKKM